MLGGQRPGLLPPAVPFYPLNHALLHCPPLHKGCQYPDHSLVSEGWAWGPWDPMKSHEILWDPMRSRGPPAACGKERERGDQTANQNQGICQIIKAWCEPGSGLSGLGPQQDVFGHGTTPQKLGACVVFYFCLTFRVAATGFLGKWNLYCKLFSSPSVISNLSFSKKIY